MKSLGFPLTGASQDIKYSKLSNAEVVVWATAVLAAEGGPVAATHPAESAAAKLAKSLIVRLHEVFVVRRFAVELLSLLGLLVIALFVVL